MTRDPGFWKAHYTDVVAGGGTQMDYSTRRRQLEGWWRMLALAGDLEAIRVLDACCGYGELAEIVRGFGGEIHAFDQVDDLKGQVSEKIDFHVANLLDAHEESWVENGFDLVLCAEAVHYVGVSRGLEALWRLVAPGGRMVVSTMSHAGSTLVAGPHVEHELIDSRGLDVACRRLPGLAALRIIGLRVADDQTFQIFERVPPEESDGFLIAAAKAG